QAAEYESNFTSRVFDSQYSNPDYGSFSWKAEIPTSTDLKIWVRGSHKNKKDTWTPWATSTAGGVAEGSSRLDDFDDYRYLQYKVEMGTDDLTVSPSLKEVKITTNISTLESSVYDGVEELSLLSWKESLPGEGDSKSKIAFQVRSSPNGQSNWTPWCGPDDRDSGCDTEAFFTSSTGTEEMDYEFTDGSDDRFVQYKAILVSGGVGKTQRPTLYETTLKYTPAEFDYLYESQFVSRVFDTQYFDPKYGIIDWNADIPENTGIKVLFHAGEKKDPSGDSDDWTNYIEVFEGYNLDEKYSSDELRYFQYKVIMGTDDLTVSPALKDIKVNTNVSTFESSLYDNTNSVQNFTWQADTPGDSRV
ncbi:MAG TPA: hypothetical protein VKO42_02560, partial [Patescibacteria group bacterium]|nr:hypothetical protein [Patescibacteria group bacterium]